MRNRLFHQYKMPDAKNENPLSLACLGNNDVITAHVSDHHPILHDGVLFWNVMMQGNTRKNKGYNNGFGIIETEAQYLVRLSKVAFVIAEIVLLHPEIEAIGLCEGPIKPLHAEFLAHTLKKFKFMKRFFSSDKFHKPNIATQQNWGLLMLTDKSNQVSMEKCDLIEQSIVFEKLANRLQIWKLTKDGKEKYLALGHFPFGEDDSATEQAQLSVTGNLYRKLINQLFCRYADKSFILCADFNFNPYLIDRYQDRALDQITHHNSILLQMEEKHLPKKVTVDGILLSRKEKQIYYSQTTKTGLFACLANEYRFFKAYFDKFIAQTISPANERNLALCAP